MSKGGSKAEQLKALQSQVDDEFTEWAKLGLHPTLLQHGNESIWAMKLQLQSMMNLLIRLEILDELDLNIEYKRLQLNDMRALLEQAREQTREAIAPKPQIIIPIDRQF